MNSVASQALFDAHVLGFTPKLLELRGWMIFGMEFPVLDVGFRSEAGRELRLRLDCGDWNDVPPAIALLQLDGSPLPPNLVLRKKTSVFHNGPHQKTGKPFICMAGSREYHSHSSHLNDHWSNYKMRSGYDLGGIVTRIWQAWLKEIQ